MRVISISYETKTDFITYILIFDFLKTICNSNLNVSNWFYNVLIWYRYNSIEYPCKKHIPNVSLRLHFKIKKAENDHFWSNAKKNSSNYLYRYPYNLYEHLSKSWRLALDQFLQNKFSIMAYHFKFFIWSYNPDDDDNFGKIKYFFVMKNTLWVNFCILGDIT